jgi:hypothetical protein
MLATRAVSSQFNSFQSCHQREPMFPIEQVTCALAGRGTLELGTGAPTNAAPRGDEHISITGIAFRKNHRYRHCTSENR